MMIKCINIITVCIAGVFAASAVLAQDVAVPKPNHSDFVGQSGPGDIRAIQEVMQQYSDAFNLRDINRRMQVTDQSYHEFGYEQGAFQQERDYWQTMSVVGGYWRSIPWLRYSILSWDLWIDGPQAFVRAITQHEAPGNAHQSIVYFTLVERQGRWWVAWDSYDIVRRY